MSVSFATSSSKSWDDKYIFTRDVRLYQKSLYGLTNDVIKEFTKRIQCPHLIIFATKCSGFEPEDNIRLILKEYEENNMQNFVLEKVDTNHHGHLTEPEKVAPVIKRFLDKYRKN